MWRYRTSTNRRGRQPTALSSCLGHGTAAHVGHGAMTAGKVLVPKTPPYGPAGGVQKGPFPEPGQNPLIPGPTIALVQGFGSIPVSNRCFLELHNSRRVIRQLS